MTSALPEPLTLDAWFAAPQQESSRCELVRGFATMSRHEAYDNRFAATRILFAVHAAVGDSHVPVTDLDVVLSEVPATVRCPDVVVAPTQQMRGAGRVYARDVDLVVEIVSPGSVETDWVTKRAEYAAAGIPAYVVVDVRGGSPRIVVFDRVEGGRYADPIGDGRTVVVTIGGHRVTLTLDDLVP